jgi:uncharacterized protein YciI
MATADQETSDLLTPMIKKTLWVVTSIATAPSSQLEPHAPAHLRYMNELESKGLLWGSGPFIIPGVVVGDGLTILNVPDESEVHHLMAEEPLVKLGLRIYTARKWELREGKISVALYLSESRASLA